MHNVRVRLNTAEHRQNSAKTSSANRLATLQYTQDSLAASYTGSNLASVPTVSAVVMLRSYFDKIYTVSQKNIPTLLAVTRESVVGFL